MGCPPPLPQKIPIRLTRRTTRPRDNRDNATTRPAPHFPASLLPVSQSKRACAFLCQGRRDLGHLIRAHATTRQRGQRDNATTDPPQPIPQKRWSKKRGAHWKSSARREEDTVVDSSYESSSPSSPLLTHWLSTGSFIVVQVPDLELRCQCGTARQTCRSATGLVPVLVPLSCSTTTTVLQLSVEVRVVPKQLHHMARRAHISATDLEPRPRSVLPAKKPSRVYSSPQALLPARQVLVHFTEHLSHSHGSDIHDCHDRHRHGAPAHPSQGTLLYIGPSGLRRQLQRPATCGEGAPGHCHEWA